MAYAVYYRGKGEKTYKRAYEITKATRGKFKGSDIAKDLRFDTLEKAEEKAAHYQDLGCETKIKEVR